MGLKRGKQVLSVRIISAFSGGVLLYAATSAAALAQGALPEDEAIYPTFRSTPHFRAFLPESADLSPFFPKAGSQGSQGSCTGWATGYGLRSYYENRAAARLTNGQVGAFSPSFVYNQLKKKPGNCSEGTRISDALRLLQSDGAVPFDDFPYKANDCSARPSSAVLTAAHNFRIDQWTRVNFREADDIKGEIADGHPVVVGMFMTDKLKKLKVGEIYTEIVPKNVKTAHAMVLVAYSDKKQAFKIFNSWGTSWADGGFGWISYEALQHNANSAFSVRVPKPETPWGGLLENAKSTPPKSKPLKAAPPAPREPTLEEKLAALTTDYGCSRFAYKVFNGNAARLTGFVSSDADLEKLRSHAFALGDQLRLNFQVEVREWPQCEALITFAHPMENARGLAIGLVRASGGRDLIEGEKLVIEVTTPDFPSYLYVTYLQSGGDAIHLVRADPSALPLPPGKRIIFGDDPSKPSFRIARPYGREMILAIAAPKPLFKVPPSIAEEERRYLTEFRKAILAQTGTQNEGLMAAAYTYLTTHPMAPEKQ